MTISRRSVLFILFSASLLFLMSDSIQAAVEFALDTSNVSASQILLVPFISAAVIYLRWNAIFLDVQYSVFAGPVVMLAGLALFLIHGKMSPGLRQADGLALAISALVVLWIGGFLLFFGSVAFRKALFPLLFLLFCIPLPTAVEDRVIAFLRLASSEVAFVLLKVIGTPVYRDGFVFAMPGLVIDVAPECSGIRSSIATLLSALLAAEMMLYSWWRRTALVAVALPILVLKNAVRIDTLSLLAMHVDRGFLDGRLHHDGGVVFFLLGLFLLYPVLVLLMKSEARNPSWT